MELFDYQNEGISWMLEREHYKCIPEMVSDIKSLKHVRGGILADEVGLGKTLQTIKVIQKNKQKNTLILVPKSLVKQWTNEFKKFAKHIELSFENEIEINENPDIVHVHIASHSKLNSKNINVESNIFTKVEWDRIVIDEAHVIRNKKSKMHKACKNLPSKIRWALSATPVMNKMTDVVHMLDWIGIDWIQFED